MLFHKLSAALIYALAAGAQSPGDAQETRKKTELLKLPTTENSADRRAILEHAFQVYAGTNCAAAPAEVLHYLCSDQVDATVPSSYTDAWYRDTANGTSVAIDVSNGVAKRNRQCADQSSNCCCLCRPNGVTSGGACSAALNNCQPTGGSIENYNCGGQPCCLFGVTRSNVAAVQACFRPDITNCS
jgi:hypothetical protein